MSILTRAKKALGASQKKETKANKADKGDVKKKTGEKASSVSAAIIDIETILSEKSLQETERSTVVLKVKIGASKGQIAQAVREKYKATPISIRTSHVRPRTRRRGRIVGKTAAWKKAYVKVDDVTKFDES